MNEQSTSPPKREILAVAAGLGAGAAIALFLLWIVRPLIAGFFFTLGALAAVAGVVLVVG